MLAAVASLSTAMGPEGAALGTVLGESTLLGGYLICLRRVAPAALPDPTRPVRAFGAALAAAGLALVVDLADWLACSLALIAYALLVMLVRAVPDELYDFLRSLRRG